MPALNQRYLRGVRTSAILLFCLVLGGLSAATAIAGGLPETTVEAGVYLDYVAPDATAPTDGAIRFGFSGLLETITADAELVPPADTNLPWFVGGTPTCLSVTREGGSITRLEFVSGCTVSGTVVRVDDVYGPDADAYLIGDRLAAPVTMVEGDPAYATLIGVPAAAGTTLAVTFQVDTTVGAPTSFTGVTSVTGPVTDLGNGDFMVGDATLPSAEIDDASRASLTSVAGLGVDVTVDITGDGIIQVEGEPTLEVSLSVSFPAPTAAPTATSTAAPTANPTPAPTAGELPDTGVATPGDGGPWWPALPAAMLLAAGTWRLVEARRRV